MLLITFTCFTFVPIPIPALPRSSPHAFCSRFLKVLRLAGNQYHKYRFCRSDSCPVILFALLVSMSKIMTNNWPKIKCSKKKKDTYPSNYPIASGSEKFDTVRPFVQEIPERKDKKIRNLTQYNIR